jgi:RimJ/RimL family protein N-acetyltransferase
MTKPPLLPIESDRIVLRLLTEGDLPMTLAWRNQPRVRANFVTSRELTEAEHRAWFEDYVRKDDDFVFVVCERAGLKPVGQAALYHVDWKARTAEFGRLMIGPDDALGKGLATEATRLLLSFGFGQLRLRRIRLEVLSSNGRAIAIYRKLGFIESDKQDGLLFMTNTAFPPPRHSVILGSYNRPRLVREAITSVLEQTDPDWQLVVTDDGSNAETVDAITELVGRDRRCQFLTAAHVEDRQERRDCANRAVQRINDAIPLLEGEFVHYLPDDDYFPPDRFSTFARLFQQPDVVVGYGRLVLVDGGRHRIKTWYADRIEDPLDVLDHKQVVHRRRVFERFPRWPDAVDWGSEGHFFRLLRSEWEFHGIDHEVAFHRWHDWNMQKTKESSTGRRE